MKAEIVRMTDETQIELELTMPGEESLIEIECGFLSHMVNLLCHRANMGIKLKAKGDTEVDYHHLAEDIGIAMGEALKSMARQSGKINRYGWALLPMDGSLARIALDFSGRGGCFFKGNFPSERCGGFDLELVPEFFKAMARSGGITLHIAILEADNSHHAAEAIFKGMGLSLRQALAPSSVDPSTKGMWL